MKSTNPFAIVIIVLMFASFTPAQQAAGVGGSIKPVAVKQSKTTDTKTAPMYTQKKLIEPAKIKKVKAAKEKKPATLYTVPKSAPWYQGGGPGIAGVK